MADWFDSGWVQLALYTASWGNVCGGIWTLFERVQTVASTQFTSEMANFIKNTNPERTLSRLAQLLASAMDAVFGSKHFSWRCFRRSCVASAVWTTCLFLLWAAIRPEEIVLMDAQSPVATNRVAQYAGDLTFLIIFSLIPDYFALLKTRWLVNRARTVRSRSVMVALLVVDVLGAVAIFIVACLTFARFIRLFMNTPPIPNPWTLTQVVWTTFVHAVTLKFTTNLTSQSGYPVYIMFGPSLYSTLFASIWAWLYISSSFVSRAGIKAHDIWTGILPRMNVGGEPFRALATISILIATCIYVLGLPLILLF
jgi:hypothetical protein